MEYKISNRLKIAAIVMIVLGVLGVGFGFMNSHKYQNEADVKALLASEAHHGGGHAEEAHGDSTSHAEESHGVEAHAEEGHKMSHEEHVLHQIHNRPYSALYLSLIHI